MAGKASAMGLPRSLPAATATRQFTRVLANASRSLAARRDTTASAAAAAAAEGCVADAAPPTLLLPPPRPAAEPPCMEDPELDMLAPKVVQTVCVQK